MQSTRPLVRHRLSNRYFPTTAVDFATVADFCAETATRGAAVGATTAASAEVVAESAPTPTNAAAVRVAPSLRRMPMFPLSFPQRVFSQRQTSPRGVWLVTNQNNFPRPPGRGMVPGSRPATDRIHFVPYLVRGRL